MLAGWKYVIAVARAESTRHLWLSNFKAYYCYLISGETHSSDFKEMSKWIYLLEFHISSICVNFHQQHVFEMN